MKTNECKISRSKPLSSINDNINNVGDGWLTLAGVTQKNDYAGHAHGRAGWFNSWRNMEQILCMVSDEAKTVLLDWQRKRGFHKQGDALQELLIAFKEQKCQICGHQRLED